ncbi:Mitochondrial import inner membrane translocase subunit Tim17/Tim22/Tim23 family protein [Hibiscus syriacus]|uniref:Mitochondrial import inner membrane translocase subunit Tim17/Tim22/Tim23 family protein n=1 Tax=Hibiscus syriacus TaxID=106335 RepID=A0A6A3D2B4_HIBSY|nr:kinesin-like protein KIN-12F [Hibiscus syriacus]KAE8733551.1 Mitochondrial import inner membrane translocase subunit Tim17/Tim22/Tim23 family protein [Hibiscus syriacus]
MKSSTEFAVAENGRFLGSISTSSLLNLLPKSKLKKIIKKPNSENTPPQDPNIIQGNNSAQFSLKYPLSKSLTSGSFVNPSDGHTGIPLPTDSSIKKEIVESEEQNRELTTLDPFVKVVVRIRPINGQTKEVNRTVRKVSSDSLSVGDRKFTFDSVLDTNSSQEDVFRQIGVPLVKNALSGYNASILSYGQTGSGKTYTMWGPPSAMVEDPSPRSHQGIVPRFFQMLFSEIQREQENSDGKQTNYQCRCSFLEIYNEQIGDLLDPTQRNLEIKDDPKNGVYVENLTEEYVTSYEDVTQILIKGLSSRKVGATTVNSKSSRSHIVFTFVIESWCKEASSKCFGSSKTSRISLIDLAGLDRNKLEDVSRQHVQEDKNVKKSLSQLGYLVNTLAKETQPEKPEDVPYRGSSLTRILKESLGGNAKLTVICNISADNRNSSEILSTLRFGQRIKFIRNEPVINEISEDHVNGLSDQIRQLKEELIRAKSDTYNSVGGKTGYVNGWNARESLNQLRVSLNRSLILPRIDNDIEEVLNIREEDIKELCLHLDYLHSSTDTNLRDPSDKRCSIQSSSVRESCETDLLSEDDIHCPKETEIKEIDVEELPPMVIPASTDDLSSTSKTLKAVDPSIRNSISINPHSRSSNLEEPTLSESPKIENNLRKSMAVPSSLLASQNNVSENSESEALLPSLKASEHIKSSLRASKTFLGPTESLAASLQRGLQIIDNHQHGSASNISSVAFSFEHLMLKPWPEADKANASVQTLPNDKPSSDGSSTPLLCSSCQKKFDNNNPEGVQDGLKTWIVTVDNQQRDGENSAVTRDLEEAAKSEKTLESICREQAAKIEELNHLVEQYKLEREISAIEHAPEHSKNEIIPFEQSNNGGNGKEYFDMSEKEALIQEIQTLKSKLQSYAAPSPNMSSEKLRSSLLSRSIQLRKSLDCRNNSEEELERERQRWMEMESDWISLTDELRMDLESIRCRAEKAEMELKLEKKCTEELDDALSRSVLCHARMVEHYADLQEKYNDLVRKHRAIMEGIAEVKKAAEKAGSKGHGARFAKSLATELSALRVEREREKEQLKKENKSLKIQLRDTAEAVHAAGELLVRLREAEQAASIAEENFGNVQQENEKLKKQVEKLKRKHKMEMVTMKQYLAESRLPESALQPLYREDSDVTTNNSSAVPYDDQAWRAEFGAIYQEHY